jgi:phosphate-selective porin OprO and OprP
MGGFGLLARKIYFRRLLVCGFTLLIIQMSATIHAQSVGTGTAVNHETGRDDTATPVKAWQGPTLRARGRIYGSFESIEAPDEDARIKDAYLRRIDLTVRGSLLPELNYYVKTELKDGEFDIRDAYFAYDVGFLTVQAGFLDPIDEIIQPAYREFMEVSTVEGFPPGNQLGIGLLHEGEIWTFFVSALRHTIDINNFEKAGTLFSTRFTVAVPVPEGYLLHLGGYASSRKSHAEQDLFRYSARSLLRTGERFVDTGDVADKELLFGFELAGGIGSISLETQCVLIRASVPAPLASHSYLNGCYVAGFWNITGEMRNYGGGGFSLIEVDRPVFEGGPGTWQVGLRYESVNLSDGPIQGGGQDAWVFSLNWHLNDQFWISGNYGRTKFDNNVYDGEVVDGLGARLQYLIEW